MSTFQFEYVSGEDTIDNVPYKEAIDFPDGGIESYINNNEADTMYETRNFLSRSEERRNSWMN